MMKVYAILFVVALIGGVGYGAVSYYNDTQQRIQILTENNAKFETAYNTQQETIGTLEKNVELQSKLNRELAQKLQQSEKYQDELRTKLQKHDLTRLSKEKPQLIEKRINDGSKKLFDTLESDTAK